MINLLDRAASAFNKLRSAERFVTVLPFGETIPAVPYNDPGKSRPYNIFVTLQDEENSKSAQACVTVVATSWNDAVSKLGNCDLKFNVRQF
jgi:hypothetical protein